MRLTSGIALTLLLMTLGCRKGADIPEPGSKGYGDLVSSFYVGLAGLQAGEDVRAREGLTRASQIAPGEPATWANLALLELRQQQFSQALEHGEIALKLAPKSSRIQELLGLIESRRGNLQEALRHFRESVALDPASPKALYALANETERLGTEAGDRESHRLLLQILRLQPNNQAVLIDATRLSAKLGDVDSLARLLSSLQTLSGSWPEAGRRQFQTIRSTATTSPRAAAVQVQFLKNLLVRDVVFRRDLDAVRPPAGTVGEPFPQFFRIQPPSSEPAPSDRSLVFASKSVGNFNVETGVTWAGTTVLDAKGDQQLVWADKDGLHLSGATILAIPSKSGPKAPLSPNAFAFGDLNYDFKTDVIMATAAGFRIFQQGVLPLFSDITSKLKLDPALINGAYTGAWLFDVDLDGDLDIVLGKQQGSPVVLRNNGDGTFKPIQPFSGVDGLRAFASADIDADGDPDVALVDANGALRVFSNERLGNYRLRPNPDISNQTVALTTGDIDGDGVMDFLALSADGVVTGISDTPSGQWKTTKLLKATGPVDATTRMLLADLDNNGGLDLVIGRQIFLHDAKGWAPLDKSLADGCVAVLDLNSDGRLDAVTRSASGQLSTLVNSGKLRYKWQILRTRAAQTSGDQRINSYGLGGEVEVRSGLLTQKQSITSPLLHFGLGNNGEVSLARIIWPNGQLQVEFDLKPDATALAQQRLKGSCPFLFAWDGTRMRFIKDCAPWSPALGLHVNAQQVAGIGQTQEWFKIPGDQVRPRDGSYDLRITGEYWETFYIDHYSFLAVDHPSDVDVFTDERFAIPPPKLKLYAMEKLRPFAKATDDNGTDVRDIVSAIDGRYLDTFGRGQYQGVTRDHWVELELPAEAAQSDKLYLVGTGWLHPTDATVNVALGQGSRTPPTGLSIEVLGADGKWKTTQAGLGFPAGRNKNVVLDLSGIFPSGAPRRLRLRTNLEIFWDRLAWAEAVADSNLQVSHLEVKSATLGYRGFSSISQADSSSPEIPDYAAVERRGPRWRDLEGYYTTFGNVLPLIEKVDDRILILNAGDELKLSVAAPPVLRQGWVRDLMMIGDGWIKDGDYNSVFSKTVLPLPYHGLKEYTKDSRSLEDDPAYKLHPEDWQTFHTRYVSPEAFSQALWR